MIPGKFLPLFLFAAFVFSGEILFCQTNNFNAYGNENSCGSHHIRLQDGGALIGSMDCCDTFLFFVKTDYLDNPVWSTKVQNRPGHTGALDPVVMHELSDGSIIVLVKGTPLVLRLSASGSILWRKELMDTAATNVFYNNCLFDFIVLPGDEMVFCGLANVTAGVQRGALMRLDPNGTLLWSKRYSSGNFDCFYNIAAASDGGYTVIGDGVSNNATALHHFDGNGTRMWSKYHTKAQFPNITYNRFISTSDDGYFLIADSTFYNNSVAMKFDSTGDLSWARTYTSNGNDLFTDVVETEQGFVVCGQCLNYTSTRSDGLLISLNKLNGTIQWRTTVNNMGTPQPRYVGFFSLEKRQTGFVTCGSTTLISYPYNVPHLVSFELMGALYCNSTGTNINSFSAVPFSSSVAGNISITAGDTLITDESLAYTPVPIIHYTACLVAVEDAAGLRPLLIYPNPATDQVTLENYTNGKLVVIYNAMGVIAHQCSIAEGKNVIDISLLPAGTYFIEVSGEDGVVSGTRFIRKQH